MGNETKSGEFEDRRSHAFSSSARWLAGGSIAIGGGVLIGWLIDANVMNVLPAHLSTKPCAALGMVLLATALWLWTDGAKAARPGRRLTAAIIAFTAVALGTVSLLEMWLGFDSGIVRLLAPGFTGNRALLRMAPHSAASIVLLGIALAFLDFRKDRPRWPAQYPAILAALVTILALLGYWYGATSLYNVSSHNPIAIQTAGGFLLITVGILCSRPDSGMMAILTSRGPGAAIIRRFLPPVLVLTILAGWAVNVVLHAELLDPELGIAMTVIAALVINSALALSIARSLEVSDVERRHAEDQVRQLNRDLERRVALRTAELEAANAALSESEERFRLMVESVRDYAIVRLDPEGRITSWNTGAERIKGYLPHEIIGKSFSIFYTAEDVASGKPAQEMERAISDGRFEDESWRVRKDGSRFWANVIVTPLYSEGSLLGFVKITRDMSERRRAEEQMRELNEELQRRTQELEASNKELEAFSYSVSHDLRAPLRSIDGFSLALLEDQRDRLDDLGKNYLDRVRAASQRMGHLIDDLLRLSRITRAQFQLEPVDLSAVAHSIIAELRENDAGHQVEVTIMPGMKARADVDLIRVAMKNLLENAWKFAGKVAVPRIEFGETKNGAETIYYVRDNGAGFDMNYAAKLFSPFQRLHAVDEFPGTGIGLALAHRIVRRHGGRVWAEGEIGRGATFFFTLHPPEGNEL